MIKIKRVLPGILLITIFYFFCAKFSFAANVSGFWFINNTYPAIIAQVEEIEKCPGKPDKHNFYSKDVLVLPYIAIEVYQDQDGFISGNNEAYGVTTNITGRVIGDSINFRCTRVVDLNYFGASAINAIITITEDYSGSVSGNNVTADLQGIYHEDSTICPFCLIQSIYNASFTGISNIQIAGQEQVDTIIISGPGGAIGSREVTFEWLGLGGYGAIEGYYYQLDSQAKVYTAGTSVTFNNLDYGPHTFSVAAKDTAGNVDSTPAIRTFAIEQNPGLDSNYGDPRDKQAKVGDPINLVTGNMHIITSDFSIPGRGLNFEFVRAYNSLASEGGPLGYGWTHSYNITLAQDEENNLVKIKDEQAKGYLFTDNGDGTYTSQRGDYSTLTKEAGGFTWRKKEGRKYTFDLSGKLTGIKDRNDNSIELSYDANGRLIKITDTVNRQINLAYDGADRITAVTSPLGRSFNYVYDAAGNLTRATDPNGNYTVYEYDVGHNLVKKTDAEGNPVYFTYDGSDRCTSSSADNNDGRITLSFDPVNKQTTLTSSKGSQTVYSYNDDLMITGTLNAQGAQTSSVWDEQFNLTSRTDEKGQTTSMAYDARGNLIKVIDARENSTLFTYEPNFNLLATSTDSEGSQTSYSYDVKGNLIMVYDADMNISAYAYNDQGQVIVTFNVLEQVTIFDYDAEGNLSRVEDALGNITYFTYDGSGRLTQSQDTKGNLTKFSYDASDNLTKVVYPDNSCVSYDYDKVGNRISVTDADSNVTSYTYDQSHRVNSVIDALGNTINYDYDTEGNLTAVSDQKGNNTSYEYDNLNLLISQADALNHKTQYQYDAAGNRISLTDAKGQAINYEYDSLNRLTKITYPDDSMVTYSYDSLGRRTSMVDSRGTTNYTYDVLSRLTKVDGPAENDTVDYTYDAVGNRLTMTDPDGRITSYAYDGLNRIVSITDPQGKATGYAYDTLGNLTEMTYPNGIKAVYTYDTLSRLLKLTHQKASAPFEKLAEFTYTYDSAGRRTALDLLDGGRIDYTYDASSRLISEISSGSNSYQISFEYDPAGNRTRMLKGQQECLYLYNELNQLIEEDARPLGSATTKITVTGLVTDAGGIKSVTVNGANALLDGDNFNCEITLTEGANTITVTAVDNAGNSASKQVNVTYDPAQKAIYTYDEKGNLIKRQLGDDTLNLTYNTENRLTQFISPGQSITYRYDGEGRRVTAIDGVATTNYLYDGLNVILERDGSGSTLAGYIRNHTLNGGIGGIIKRASPNGAIAESYYHYDGLGSVVGLTDSAGSGAQNYAYDAFGNLLSQSGSVANPYQYSSKSADPTGLIYFGARYYDPRIGRFITQDPLGISDGPNLYLYCVNSPVNWVDPWGLCVEVGYRKIDPGGLIYHTWIRIQYRGEVYEYGFDARWPGLGLYSFLSGYPVPGWVRPESIQGGEFYKEIARGTDIAATVLNNIKETKASIYHPLYNCYNWRNTVLDKSNLAVPDDNPWSLLR